MGAFDWLWHILFGSMMGRQVAPWDQLKFWYDQPKVQLDSNVEHQSLQHSTLPIDHSVLLNIYGREHLFKPSAVKSWG